MQQSGAPLDEDELAELAEFLASDRVSETTMDIAMLDGFLTALVSGPTRLPTERWLPWVWDFEQGRPQFDLPAKQAKRVVGWIHRHMEGIALAIDEDPDEFEPLFYEREFDGVVVEVPDEWCTGFMIGVGLDRDGWKPLIDAHPELFRALELHGTEAGWAELDAMPDVAERHQEFLDEIADAVREIQAHWRAQRAQVPPQGPLQATRASSVPSVGVPDAVEPASAGPTPPKIGRNAPCPCGSGKKFKHCHGSSGPT